MKLLFTLWLLSNAVGVLAIPKKIKTKLGDILGLERTEQVTKKQAFEFRRIPYAKPPVGKLRFANPKPYGPWIGTLNATKYGPSCYQDLDTSVPFLENTDISEHCLFLNIYVPNEVSKKNRKSVMVWIHGGNYAQGQGTTFNGALLAVIGDVIVVTINYRLGVFGFLSTGNSVALGNFGLLDQRLALIWIRKSISSYGGNPKSITVFGQSEGAMSISLHALYRSRLYKDLFHRVILQSGFATSPMALASNVPEYSKQLAGAVKCYSRNSIRMLNCLRNTSSVDLHQASKDVLNNLKALILNPLFGPRVCGKYIKDSPAKLLQNSKSNDWFQSLDVLIGNVDIEGSIYINILDKFQDTYNFSIPEGIPKRVLCKYVAPIVTKKLYNNRKEVSELLCEKYGSGKTLLKQTLDQIDFYGDLMFYKPTLGALNVFASRNSSAKCFQYNFKRQLRFLTKHQMPLGIKGAAHGAELAFISPITDMFTMHHAQQDSVLANTMMKYWSNFAKYGDVNDKEQITWPEYNTTDRKYLVLDVNVTPKSHFKESRLKFWNEELAFDLHAGDCSSKNMPPCFILVFLVSFTVFFFK